MFVNSSSLKLDSSRGGGAASAIAAKKLIELLSAVISIKRD